MYVIGKLETKTVLLQTKMPAFFSPLSLIPEGVTFGESRPLWITMKIKS